MPDKSLEEARFDHVADTGDLIFSAAGLKFAVRVNDRLERAILEAKQIQSEHLENPYSKPAPALPISQIQALIRAGADPAQVAQRYELSDALVRRFSAPVETEKQYAIEQFLNVPTAKESRVHNTSELIERHLALAGIGMESVTWKATRRGLEPWKITAEFASAGRQVTAEWTWNMHDNAVVCRNASAQSLFGVSKAGHKGADESMTSDGSGTTASSAANSISQIPGDSVRSARIERTVSAWQQQDAGSAQQPSQGTGRAQHSRSADEQAQQTNFQPALPDPSPAQETHGANSGSQGSERIDLSALTPHLPHGSARPSPVKPSDQAEGGSKTAPTQQPKPDSKPAVLWEESPDQEADRDSQRQDQAISDTGQATGTKGKASKRKSGRSAVPSWDEILFGD
ncbi:hypothetical protein CRD60_03305 [Bifidobacterium aemilianum]|uniref:DUF3071 domain-containing protein n=1 Tax=Bifidobacterium aemilianum TaxID=2493120 RepID=A0A366K8W1_9BIFI|nr:septation protein SepH [Bifidobacterium aemilianum]RBP98180.1 hypothetical protein CRD60_03305 [Bifidobacterium aemilianum]